MEFYCTIYTSRNARPQHLPITEISDEDAKYFNEIGAMTSMEPCGGQYALYADVGLTEDDGETPREIIVLSGAMSCKEAFSQLRAKCEKVLTEDATQ